MKCLCTHSFIAYTYKQQHYQQGYVITGNQYVCASHILIGHDSDADTYIHMMRVQQVQCLYELLFRYDLIAFKFPDFGTFNQLVIGAVLYSRSPYWYYTILFTFSIHPSVLISLYSWYIYFYVSDINFGKLSVTSFPSFK